MRHRNVKAVTLASQMVAIAQIARAILEQRGQRVLLDAELASLFSATTKALNQAVKRNAARFPEDFMFRLTRAETAALNRSNTVTGSQKHRDPRFPPCALTEHGAIMVATVLSSACSLKPASTTRLPTAMKPLLPFCRPSDCS